MRKFYSFSLLTFGLAMVAFGVFVMMNPELSLRVFTLFIGSLLGLYGIVEIVAFVEQRKVWNISFLFLLNGLLALGVSIFTFARPELAEMTYVFVFGIWVLVSAIFQMIAALSLRRIPGWGALLAIGLVLFIFALVILLSKMAAAITVSVTFGIYFIAQGMALFFAWMLLRRFRTASSLRD